MHNLRRYIDPISRVCLVLMFLLSGFSKLDNFSKTAEFMSNQGFPIASIFLIIAIVIELGAGFMIAFNYRSAQATLALLAFTIIATLSIHDFWNYDVYKKTVNKKAKIITAIGMFYDMEDPNQFISDSEKALIGDGVFIAQLMSLKNLIYFL